MKKLICIAFVAATLVSGAETVTFGYDQWAGSNGTSPRTYSISTNGLTFVLTVNAARSGDAVNVQASTYSQALGAVGGIASWELDQGSYALDTTDDESFSFSLDVTDGIENLGTLSLSGVNMRIFGTVDKVEFSDHDGGATVTHSGNANGAGTNVDTLLSDFTGLTGLNTNNLGTWALIATARDSDATDGTAAAAYATKTVINSLIFEYTRIAIGPQTPVAGNDAYQIQENTALTNAAPGVLANDWDGNGDVLTAVLVSSPTNGTLLSFSTNGAFSYQPNPGFTGTDSFTYKVSDGGLDDSNVATATLTVASVELSLPRVFNSNMILQRDLPIRVWGRGPAGKTVSVSLTGQTAETVVDAQGNWAVSLAPMAATYGPLTMMVSVPGSSLTRSDIAVGEVWLAGGQSNMAVKFTENNGQLDPTVFDMDLSGARFDNENVSWQTLTPTTQVNLSKVGGYFMLELYKELGIPVGLIQRNWSGTPIQAWMPVDASEVIRKELNIPVGWNDVQDQRNPGVQFDKSIRPIVPVTFRGVIWYQGERNAKAFTGWEYRWLLPFHIKTWREFWATQAGTPVRNFPFYYVQVPSDEGNPGDEWAWLRDGMRRALDLTENTGMAICYDVGPGLHPENKEPVGHRLALLALAKDYGRTNLVHSGPLLDQVNITGNQAILTFKHIGGGLQNKSGETNLKFFEIAGANGNYVPAEAWIAGDTVVVQSTNVLAPVYVRYLFTKPVPDNVVSLINAEGIPASSFMTDNFMPPRPGVSQPPLAIADRYSADAPLVVPAPGILANDSPGTNGTLSAQLISGVSHGTLEFSADGAFVYTPTNGYTGTDAFSYVAVNGAAQSATTTVSLAIATITSLNGWAAVYGVEASNEYVFDYAFNMDPHLSPRYILPISGTSGLPRWEISQAEGRLVLEFVRRKQASDLTYKAQFTESLLTPWSDASSSGTIVPIDTEFERVSVPDDVTAANATNRFGRVIVIKN